MCGWKEERKNCILEKMGSNKGLIYKSTGEFDHHKDDCFSGGVYSWLKVGLKWYACGPL